MFHRIHQFLFGARVLIVGFLLQLQVRDTGLFGGFISISTNFDVCVFQGFAIFFLSCWIYVHIFVHNIYYLLLFVTVFGGAPCAFPALVICVFSFP